MRSSTMLVLGVAEVKILLSAGVKGRRVAEIYNVDEKYISSIKRGKTRKYE